MSLEEFVTAVGVSVVVRNHGSPQERKREAV